MDINKVKTALAPDCMSKAAYAGRVAQTETVMVFAEDGTPIEREFTFYISWDSISEILTMVRKRADIQS